MQHNILLINTIDRSGFGGMSPLVKSPSESNGFLTDINESMESLGIIEKKSPSQDSELFTRITGVPNGPAAVQSSGRTEIAKPKGAKTVKVVMLDSPQAVVGIWSTVYVKLQNVREEMDGVVVSMEVTNGDTGRTFVPCDFLIQENILAVKALPPKTGRCTFVVQSQDASFRDAEFTVEVFGNNPEVSFSESGTDWPVTVAFKPTEKCVYLAFNHHVSKFTHDGEFVSVILKDNGAYINDLAVDPKRARLVVGVSGWRDTRGYKIRFQEVRLYSMSGTRIWTAGSHQPLLFGAPILHVAFNEEGNVMVAGHKHVDICLRGTGTIEKNVKLEELTTPSRVCATPDGGCAVAEATEGTIQVYDKDWKLKVKVPIVDHEGKRVHGVSGLAVDSSGNILVSSCEKEEFFLFDAEGKLISVIESDWDCPKWPLDLTTTNDGYVFLADHGNGCAKKYKYM